MPTMTGEEKKKRRAGGGDYGRLAGTDDEEVGGLQRMSILGGTAAELERSSREHERKAAEIEDLMQEVQRMQREQAQEEQSQDNQQPLAVADVDDGGGRGGSGSSLRTRRSNTPPREAAQTFPHTKSIKPDSPQPQPEPEPDFGLDPATPAVQSGRFGSGVNPSPIAEVDEPTLDTSAASHSPRSPSPTGGLALRPATVSSRSPPKNKNKNKKKNHSGVPTPEPRSASDTSDEENPVLRNRGYWNDMEATRDRMAVEQGEKASEKRKEVIKKSVGPLAETLDPADGKNHEEIKYGEIRFDENGRVVPYLIIPEHMRDSDELLEAITAMKHVTANAPDGVPLEKPTAIFDVCSAGTTYMDWCKDIGTDDSNCKPLHDAWWHPHDNEDDGTLKHTSSRKAALPSKRKEDVKDDDKPQAFAEQMLSVVRTLTACLQESNSWLFTPAGRGAAAQLIGHTIDRFRGSPEDMVWMQYASLWNWELFGENHDDVVEQLRESAVKLSEKDSKKLKSRVFYPSQRMNYPSATDLHRMEPGWFSQKGDPECYENIKRLGTDIHPRATHLLFFEVGGHHGGSDRPARHARGYTAELLPHDHIEKVKGAMKAQGVSEGLVLMNGGINEMNAAANMVAQLNPVIAFKHLGGASEIMAQIFQEAKAKRKNEHRDAVLEEERKDVETAKADLQHFESDLRSVKANIASVTDAIAKTMHADKRRLERAVREATKKVEKEQDEFRYSEKKMKKDKKVEERRHAADKEKGEKVEDEVHDEESFDQILQHLKDNNDPNMNRLISLSRFMVPPRAHTQEMLVIDPTPRNGNAVHDVMQRQVAEMKEKQIDTNERMHGFKALEMSLLDQAWEDCAIYEENSEHQRILADTLEYITNLFNVIIVAIVVIKQFYYPDLMQTPMCKAGGTCAGDDVCVSGNIEDLVEYGELWGDGSMADSRPRNIWWIWMWIHDYDHLKTLLILLPIINGVLLTLISQLDPKNKWHALKWADAALESETYTYRARAMHYSASKSSGWRKNGAAGPSHHSKTLAAKTYAERCKDIKGVLLSESTFGQSHLHYPADRNEARTKRKIRVVKACQEPEVEPGCLVSCCQALVSMWDEDEDDLMIKELEEEIVALKQEAHPKDTVDMEKGLSREDLSRMVTKELEESKEKRKQEQQQKARADLPYKTEELEELKEKRKQEQQQKGAFCCAWDVTCGAFRRCTNSCITVMAGADACTRCRRAQRSNHRVIKLEEIDERTHRPKTRQYKDDGYGRLEANTYLAVRTEVHRAKLKQAIQPIGKKLRNLKMAVAVSTTISVALGSFEYDLFIAASTALVSFFSTLLEYGEYGQLVKTSNTSIKLLDQAWQEWHGLTFHEKRQPSNVDRLVRQTESAIMAEYEAFFTPSKLAGKDSQDKKDTDEANGGSSSKKGT